MSALSHEEPGWQLVDEGETIPYESAFIAREQMLTPTSRRLAAEIAQRYGIERSTQGHPSRADFEVGPLAAARLQFERFDLLPQAAANLVDGDPRT